MIQRRTLQSSPLQPRRLSPAGAAASAQGPGSRSKAAGSEPEVLPPGSIFVAPEFKKLALTSGASALGWVAASSAGGGGQAMALAFFGFLSLWMVFAILQKQATTALVIIAYLSAIQPALRMVAPVLPYLALNYLLIVFAGLLLIKNAGQIRMTLPLLFYGVYIIMELVGLTMSESLQFGRTVVINSLAIFMFLLLSSQARFTSEELRRVLCGYLVGATTIVGLIGRNYISGKAIQWGTESNFAASGDMGPNQLTIILAISIFICFVFSDECRGWERFAYWGLAGLTAFFMVMTFSRGGLYLLVGALFLYYLVLRKPTLKTVVALSVLGSCSALVFFAAVSTSQGKVLDRYSEVNTSNRSDLAARGWQICQENPLLGVGTGNYYSAVENTGFRSQSGAHNEVTRAAAEHGLPGLFAWMLFAGGAVVQAIRGRGSQTREFRALRLIFLGLGLISMVYNGLKLMVQPLLILFALSAFAGEYTIRAQNVGHKLWARRPGGAR